MLIEVECILSLLKCVVMSYSFVLYTAHVNKLFTYRVTYRVTCRVTYRGMNI